MDMPFIPSAAPPWGIMGVDCDPDGIGYYCRVSPEYLIWLQSILMENCNCQMHSDHNGCLSDVDDFVKFAKSLEPIAWKKS